MKKVVILGCENSHADDFLRIINEFPKFIINAIMCSLETGKEEIIKEIKL